jgi:hypothetical protein
VVGPQGNTSSAAGGSSVKSTKSKPCRPNQSISSSGFRAGWFIAPIFMAPPLIERF